MTRCSIVGKEWFHFSLGSVSVTQDSSGSCQSVVAELLITLLRILWCQGGMRRLLLVKCCAVCLVWMVRSWSWQPEVKHVTYFCIAIKLNKFTKIFKPKMKLFQHHCHWPHHRIKLLDETETDRNVSQNSILNSLTILHMPSNLNHSRNLTESCHVHIKMWLHSHIKHWFVTTICLSCQFSSRTHWPTSHVLSHCGQSSIVECGGWVGCQRPHMASWGSVQNVCVKSLVIVNT